MRGCPSKHRLDLLELDCRYLIALGLVPGPLQPRNASALYSVLRAREPKPTGDVPRRRRNLDPTIRQLIGRADRSRITVSTPPPHGNDLDRRHSQTKWRSASRTAPRNEARTTYVGTFSFIPGRPKPLRPWP